MSFKEQIMSKDKYPSIFSPQKEALSCLLSFKIFFATRAVLKIGGYSGISPSFSWRIFVHVMCSDQSHASEKIYGLEAWLVRGTKHQTSS